MQLRLGERNGPVFCLYCYAAQATILSMVRMPTTGKLLGHTQVQTTARYAHLAADPIKLAANSISNQLAEMMVG